MMYPHQEGLGGCRLAMLSNKCRQTASQMRRLLPCWLLEDLHGGAIALGSAFQRFASKLWISLRPARLTWCMIASIWSWRSSPGSLSVTDLVRVAMEAWSRSRPCTCEQLNAAATCHYEGMGTDSSGAGGCTVTAACTMMACALHTVLWYLANTGPCECDVTTSCEDMCSQL